MTSSIILKKSSVASRVPVVGDLAYGELALNYADGALYYKRSDNTIQNLLAGSGGGVSSFNTRTGAITLTNGDVTDALGYTPFSSDGGTISGNMLISVTASATPPLDINHAGSLTYGLRVGDTDTVSNNTGIYLRTTSTATVAWGAGGELVFATSGGSVTRFVIGSSGQWGIGASEDFGLNGQVCMSQGASAAPVWKLPGTRVTTIATGTSITLNCDTTDLAKQVNTQAAGTLTINAPTGTPVDGQRIMLRITSTNVQNFSWNAVFAGSTDMVLPTASSGGGKEDYLGFIYDSVATKWHLIAKSFGY